MSTAHLAPALILAVVLLISGTAKLRAPQTVAESFRELRVPQALGRPAVRTAFPWAELLLGVALLVLPGPLAPLVAVLALALFGVYWALIYRARGFEEPVACHCLGQASAEPVTRWTLWRNTVLVLLAGWWLVASFRGSAPARLALTTGNDRLWILGGALACLLLWFALHRVQPASATSRAAASSRTAVVPTPRPEASVPAAGHDVVPPWAEAPEESEAEDYLRTPIPPVLVRDAAGQFRSLHRMAREGAMLLLYVSPGCGPCVQVIRDAARWSRELGPVTVHLVVTSPQDVLEARAAEPLWATTLYDVGNLTGETLGLAGTPSAVLLGTDGLLAGGPVAGPQEIEAFVEQIREQLAEARTETRTEGRTEDRDAEQATDQDAPRQDAAAVEAQE